MDDGGGPTLGAHANLQRFFRAAMTALDAGLIVTAIIIPVLLLLANLVILAKYIDPQHAAGHYVSKFVLVRS